MNTAINNQSTEGNFVPQNSDAAPVVKRCTNCQSEFQAITNIRYTSFGLELCEDCLYT